MSPTASAHCAGYFLTSRYTQCWIIAMGNVGKIITFLYHLSKSMFLICDILISFVFYDCSLSEAKRWRSTL